jgi:phosphonate transport system substrate-binding protein
MFKKSLVAGITLALATTAFVGCGTSSDNAKQGTDTNKSAAEAIPKTLTVGFIPSSNAETLSSRAKPLEDMLKKELNMDVKVTVTTNYSALIEAMAAKKIDVGFLSPVDYVFAHDKRHAATLLLQTVRNGSDHYRAELVKLASDNTINDVKDIKGKKIAFVSPTSAGGYLYPQVMIKAAGLNPKTDVQPIMAGGNDKTLMALYRGDVQVAAAFDDARTLLTKDYPDVMTKLKPFAYSEDIPNDTVSIRPGFPDDFNTKVQQAFINIMKTPEGKKVGKDIYQFDDLVPGKDSNFDSVRKMIESNNVSESK